MSNIVKKSWRVFFNTNQRAFCGVKSIDGKWEEREKAFEDEYFWSKVTEKLKVFKQTSVFHSRIRNY